VEEVLDLVMLCKGIEEAEDSMLSKWKSNLTQERGQASAPYIYHRASG